MMGREVWPSLFRKIFSSVQFHIVPRIGLWGAKTAFPLHDQPTSAEVHRSFKLNNLYSLGIETDAVYWASLVDYRLWFSYDRTIGSPLMNLQSRRIGFDFSLHGPSNIFFLLFLFHEDSVFRDTYKNSADQEMIVELELSRIFMGGGIGYGW